MACKKQTPKITAAVGYVRVSTDDQSLGADVQRESITRLCAQHGIELLRIYEDIGISGGADLEKRPGLMTALDSIGKGIAFVVMKRCRLSRDRINAGMVERLIERAGGKVWATDGVSNDDTPEAEMMRGIIDVFAQFERAIIRARTKAALARKQSQGERTGGVPYGKQLNADGIHLDENAQEQVIIAMAQALHAEGKSTRKIATALAEQGMLSRAGTIFTPSAIINMLHS